MIRINTLFACLLLIGWQGVAAADGKYFKPALATEENNTKVIVAEFADSDDKGIGKSISYLMSRELSLALGGHAHTVRFLPAGLAASCVQKDQEGTAKICVEDIKEGRHKAASELAKAFNASIVLWGDVTTIAQEGGRHKVEIISYVTLNPKISNDELSLQFHRSASHTFQALTSRFIRQIEFSPQTNFVDELLVHQLIVRTLSNLYSRPSFSASVVDQNLISIGSLLDAEYVGKEWFKVSLPNNVEAYIESRYVFVMLQNFDAKPHAVHLYKKDTAESKAKYQMALQKNLAMSNMSKLRFMLRAQHFVAGLAHYRAQRFEEAYWELFKFLDWAGNEESSDIRAAAYQLQGASLLIFKDSLSIDRSLDIQPFEKALSLVEDAESYSLSAVARLGMIVSPDNKYDDVFNDLRSSLNVDIENKSARQLIIDLNKLENVDFSQPSQQWALAVVGVERVRACLNKDILAKNADTCINKTENGGGENAMIKIKNNTGHKLNLYFVGCEYRTEVVPAERRNMTVKLREGTYEIAIETSKECTAAGSLTKPLYVTKTYMKEGLYELNLRSNWRGEP